MVGTVIAGALAGLSGLTTIWQWIVGARFPLHRRLPSPAFTPPLSLLKPLKGADTQTAVCLESWFAQDYPGPLQLLFGVASDDDPVCPVVRDLMARHPQVNAELVVCPESLGANAKVSTLAQLDRRARHGVVVISDADIWAPADFLSNLAALLRGSDVGLVSAFYSLAAPRTLAMRWEAVMINADFWSQVLMGTTFRALDFALGAAIAVRREALQQAGGFAALVDHLADDFQVGNRVQRAGWKLALCPVPVEIRESAMSLGQAWRHQLRWARTIRVCKPAGHFGSVITNATLWPLVWVAADPRPRVVGVAAVLLLLRVISAFDLQRRLTRSLAHLPWWWLVPVKDLLNAIVWALSFLGNRVEWRGRRFRVRSGGKLVPVGEGRVIGEA